VDASPAPDLRKPHPPSLSPRALAIAGWSAFLVAGLLFLGLAWNISARPRRELAARARGRAARSRRST